MLLFFLLLIGSMKGCWSIAFHILRFGKVNICHFKLIETRETFGEKNRIAELQFHSADKN